MGWVVLPWLWESQTSNCSVLEARNLSSLNLIPKALRITESVWSSVHTGRPKKLVLVSVKDSGSSSIGNRSSSCRLDTLTNKRKRPAGKTPTALAGEMAQWVKAFTTKPDAPTLIFDTHMVEGKN